MIVVEYNKDWKKHFYQIKEILEKNLSKVIGIEHIGSTAIIGMCAKPIIDIDIIIDNINDFEKIKNELELIGYAHEGNLGIIGRDAFRRNNTLKNKILDKINHHLYVCTKDNDELKRHILFRDYLNKNFNKKMEYSNIKKKIIEKYGNEDKEKYVSVKETEYKWFFEKMIKEAELEK